MYLAVDELTLLLVNSYIISTTYLRIVLLALDVVRSLQARTSAGVQHSMITLAAQRSNHVMNLFPWRLIVELPPHQKLISSPIMSLYREKTRNWWTTNT